MVKDAVREELRTIVSHLNRDRQDDTIFDVPGLCQYLKVTRKWVYEQTHLKAIPHAKIGGQLRFRKRRIDEWVDSHSTPAVTEPTGKYKLLK